MAGEALQSIWGKKTNTGCAPPAGGRVGLVVNRAPLRACWRLPTAAKRP